MKLAISVIYYNGVSVPVPNDDVHGRIYTHPTHVYRLFYSDAGRVTYSYIVAQLW